MRRVAALAVVLVVCAPLSACGSSAPVSHRPDGLRARIVAAALAQKSVHWTETFGADIYGTEHASGDVTADSGEERVTYYGSAIDIILVDHTIYVRGHGALLEERLGLTAPQATRYAERWIAIPHTADFARLQAEGGLTALTLPALLHRVVPQGKLQVSRKIVNGARVLEVRGSSSAFLTERELTVPGRGLPLPAAYSNGCGDLCGGTGHFSAWNEPVHVQAPAHSIPIATVRG